MKKWSMNEPWVKKSDYILRCIEESFGPSNSSGNPMITLKFEVAAPDSVVGDDGEEMSVAGVPITAYFVTKSLNGSEKQTAEEASANCLKNLQKLYTAFELSTDDINVDNPTLGFKSKCVYALLDNEEKEQRGSPTKADLAKGIKQGAILINPKTKKPLTINYPRIGSPKSNAVDSIFGLAEVTTGTPTL